ncbi:transposase [Streptomyces sp. B15]|uniref:transposase n=1 Tax=Streptomyces sp. B15 TaxID=1537797 RepID=UPI0027DD6331|nr:transposase [Streptomyces sp. B15]
MTGRSGLLELAPGMLLVLEGASWSVKALDPVTGTVELVDTEGQLRSCSAGRLLDLLRVPEEDLRPVQSPRLEDLEENEQERMRLRVAHALEADCGFRSGDRACPAPGEPRPEYDPGLTTRLGRFERKAAELRQLSGEEARLLGLQYVSARTLRRIADECRSDPAGLRGYGRQLRSRGSERELDERLVEAIEAVRAECQHRSRVSMRTKERMIHQYVREILGGAVSVPSYSTLRRIWLDWYGSSGGRQKYVRSASATEPAAPPVVALRPGQVVALDTQTVPVKLLDDVFSDPVTVSLTLALDVFTRSIVAFRLNVGSDTGVDVAMVLRDVMLPLPMRPGWGKEMAWPYPGVPGAVVADFAGYEPAGLPFFAPETLTTDHGSVYKNHHVVEVERLLGCNILPARAMRPTDKQAVERCFGTIRSLLFEQLLGYTGVDVADRGSDPEADAAITVNDMEHLIATWVVRVWQNRKLAEHAPPWAPDQRHSPNTLFTSAFARGGFALRMPTPDLFYRLLPAHHVTVRRKRGVKVHGLWYDGPVLDECGARQAPKRGRHAHRWRVNADPRDLREVFFEYDGVWHRLRWTGLPPEGEIPAFSDARAEDLLAETARRGIQPRDDSELLPLLLELLETHQPVSRWITQPGGKRQRSRSTRDERRTRSASQDRHKPRHAEPRQVATSSPDGRRAGKPRQVSDVVDAERARRRRALPAPADSAPARLGDAYRQRSMFALPSPDDEPDTPTPPPAP